MKIVVTGGSGQLGTLLLRRLFGDRGVESVISIDLRPPLLRSRKLQWIRADVRDPDIGQYFQSGDAIVHLAYLVSGYYAGNLAEEVNVQGSRNVFTQAMASGVPHLVFCSSVAAYGAVPGHPMPLVENSPRRFQPEFGYAATKFKVEEWLDAIERDRPDVIVSRIRPAILVGPQMPNLMGTMLRHRLLPDMGAPLPVVWDEDVVEALVLILRMRAPGAFNLAADSPMPTRELAASVRMRPVRVPPRFLARPLAELSRVGEWLRLGYSFDPAWLTCGGVPMTMSSQRAREVLGWKPRCPTTLDVLTTYVTIARRRSGARIRWFFRAVRMASWHQPKSLELAGMHLLIHLMLTGPEGADYSILVEDGRLRMRPGLRRPADAVITMKSTLFLKLLCGRSSWSQELLAGRILAEGQPHAWMVVAGIISNFRGQVHTQGPQGWGPRLLGRWLASTGDV